MWACHSSPISALWALAVHPWADSQQAPAFRHDRFVGSLPLCMRLFGSTVFLCGQELLCAQAQRYHPVVALFSDVFGPDREPIFLCVRRYFVSKLIGKFFVGRCYFVVKLIVSSGLASSTWFLGKGREA